MAAPMRNGEDQFCPCDNIIRFKKSLNKFRLSDDKFIYKLNAILPTQSFKNRTDPTVECENVYHQMLKIYDNREQSIHHCIGEKKTEIQAFREQLAANSEDSEAKHKLNTAALMLKQLEKEVPQEQILKNKSFKLFYERCSDHYMPPSSS